MIQPKTIHDVNHDLLLDHLTTPAATNEAGHNPTPILPNFGQKQFGYLFPQLQKPESLLPTSPHTVKALRALGAAMREDETTATPDSDLPSVYTYFGQFIDHDITRMDSPRVNLRDPTLKPLSPMAISNVTNLRSPWLDLDSIYNSAPRDGDDRLLLGKLFKEVPLPLAKADGWFDFPRNDRSPDPRYDRTPLIGDFRNDETTIIGQLTVAFMQAHNSIVEAGYQYSAARSLLRRYYQMVIAYDFLPRIADPAIVTEMLSEPWSDFDPSDANFFMPLEFSVAAYRFGHSMVRNAYRLNDFRPQPQPLLQLFNVLGRWETPSNVWTILWENFVENGVNKARMIDTHLSSSLFTIPGLPEGDEFSLPHRTLLKGYLLSLPTGQAVAQALKLHHSEILSAEDIEGVAARIPDSTQLKVLQQDRMADDGTIWKLSARTPLWFYILAEATHNREVRKRGNRLGPVGSKLVAGVLIALIRRSEDSILKIPGWPPARNPQFTLSDLLHLGKAL